MAALSFALCVDQPYRDLDREEWMEMAASAPKRLEASIPVWPKGFDPELREVSWVAAHDGGGSQGKLLQPMRQFSSFYRASA